MIGILCSAIGLGHYVPGLLVREELLAAGCASHVLVFENFIKEEQRAAIVKARTAYQRNPGMIRIGQKLIPRLHAGIQIDRAAIRNTVSALGISRFTVLTGFWLPMLFDLASSRSFKIDLLHVDSVISPSWEATEQTSDALGASHIWLSNHEKGRIDYAITVDCIDIPFAKRRNAIVAHGGGWALGTYKEVTSGIAASGYDVHIVMPTDVAQPAWATSVFRLDPDWEPWSAVGGVATFPPLIGHSLLFDRPKDGRYHDLLEVSRHVKGVVSKPGGATILDCIATSTPLIWVEPQGQHEARNAELWTSLGLAISLDDWAGTSFSNGVLYDIHVNLRQIRKRTPSYVRDRILRAS